MWEAAEKGFPALTCFLGPWAETEHWQKRVVFLHYLGCDCRRGGGGETSCSPCPNPKGTGNNTCSTWNYRLFSEAQGQLPANAHDHGCQGGVAGHAHRASSDNDAWPECTPQAQRPAGCCLSSCQIGSGNEAPTTAPYSPSIWPGHACGIDIKEDYSCQLQV